jgi:hypothetical protein
MRSPALRQLDRAARMYTLHCDLAVKTFSEEIASSERYAAVVYAEEAMDLAIYREKQALGYGRPPRRVKH